MDWLFFLYTLENKRLQWKELKCLQRKNLASKLFVKVRSTCPLIPISCLIICIEKGIYEFLVIMSRKKEEESNYESVCVSSKSDSSDCEVGLCTPAARPRSTMLSRQRRNDDVSTSPEIRNSNNINRDSNSHSNRDSHGEREETLGVLYSANSIVRGVSPLTTIFRSSPAKESVDGSPSKNGFANPSSWN